MQSVLKLSNCFQKVRRKETTVKPILNEACLVPSEPDIALTTVMDLWTDEETSVKSGQHWQDLLVPGRRISAGIAPEAALRNGILYLPTPQQHHQLQKTIPLTVTKGE